MYLEDLKKDFYEFLTGKQIVLVVHYDIDSICTCKILQSLLRHNNVTYTLSVVKSLSDLKETFHDTHQTDVKYYVLINCGGTCDLVDVLEPPDDVTFFVLDSHRPLDLCNVYSNGQVRIVTGTSTNDDDDVEVPEFADVFREESDDDDEEGDGHHDDDSDDSGTNERAAKRRRVDEHELDKRREKRLWEAKRNKILFEYTQFTYYAKASAMVMYELAWQLNKEDVDALWLASVAITEQFLFDKIETTTYVLATTNLQSHVNRLSRKQMPDHHDAGNDVSVVSSAPRMTFENDTKLVLYRHWSIFNSLKFSPYTACKMKLWSHRGAKKLQELLADMGFPLVQSQQSFQSMDLQLRREFRQTLEKVAEKYDIRDVTYPSFVRRQGYRQQYAASDFVYALLAILESSAKEGDSQECFNVALDCLSSSRSRSDVMYSAIERAKVMSMTIFKMVQAAVDMKQIVTAGPFIYYIIQEGCLDWNMFSNQHVLSQLAHFILTAYVSMSRNKKAPTLPLIVSAPKNPELGTCVVMGIPPLCENSPKNFFGKAFEQAALKINCDSSYDYFDSSYFQVFTKDRTRFFDALTSLLT